MAADVSANGHDGQLGSAITPDGRDPLWMFSGPPTNQAPQANAGLDQHLIWSASPVTLAGVASDDGLPVSTLFSNWTVVSGPGTVTFADPTSANTTATFASPGTYVLRLTVDDTALTDSDEVTVQLDAQASLTTIQVTPGFALVLTGNSQQFVATGFDQTGTPFPITPTWGTTGGSIDAAGLFVAGSSVGQFEVSATDAGISGQANVSVTDSIAPWPTSGWTLATPQEVGLDQTLLEQARDYAQSGGGAGYITRHGRLVMSWGSDTALFSLKSTTKSIGGILLGVAVNDGLVQLGDLAQLHLPGIGLPPSGNASTGWLDEISVLNLATQTAGFEKPGGFIDQLYQPGTTWAYTDGGVNWLADMLTTVYVQDLNSMAFSRVFTQLGLDSGDLTWRDHLTRPDLIDGIKRREFSSGISANVDALARIGYLMLRQGEWDSSTVIPSNFVDQVRVPVPGVEGLPVSNDIQSRFAGASNHYGIMWWNNADGSIAGLPTDAYWAWGLFDSLIVVIPSLDMVVSRAGSSWSGSRDPSYYQVLEPFLVPIAQAAQTGPQNQAPVVGAGADQQITLPTDTVNLLGTASDDDLPSATLTTTWSVVSGSAVVFADSTAPMTTATFTSPGTYVLRLTADDTLLTGSDDVTITVSPVPDVTPPSVTLTAPTAGLIGGAVTVAATANDNVAIASVEFRAGSTVIGTDTTAPYSLLWDSTTVANGGYTITAEAMDTSGNTATDSVAVTVENGAPVNQPPVVVAGADQQITWPTDTVNLSGTANDDGLPSGTLTTTWSVFSGPGTVVFGDSALLTTTAQFSTDGTYVLQLTGDDSALSSADNLTVTVAEEPLLANIVLTPTQATLPRDTSQQFTAVGEDQYGGVFAINPVWTATGGTVDQSGFYLAGSIVGPFTVTATDGAISASATINITDSAPTQTYLEFADDYVEIADSNALDLAGGMFTVSAWIKPSDWGENDQGRIVDHGGGSPGGTGWALGLENKVSKGSPRALRMRINDSTAFAGQSTDDAIQLDVWQHVAATHDGTALTLYVNGVPVGQAIGAPVPIARDDVLRIGARSTDDKRFFEGAIDEVRLWDRALSQPELVALMNQELTGLEAGLVAYYSLNEGAGQVAADISANAQDGQLGSAATPDGRDPTWINDVP